MHYVIIVIVSVILGVSPLPTIAQQPLHKAEAKHVTAASAPKPEEVKPEITKPAVEKVLTWQDNPQNCNQDTQYIAEAAPYNCIDKPVASPIPAPTVSQPSVAVADDGSAKSFIYMHESGNNPGSINSSSGACGLGQALPCSKMPCSLSDYACQDSFFTSYMVGRYGTWENAKAFWLSHSWW